MTEGTTPPAGTSTAPATVVAPYQHPKRIKWSDNGCDSGVLGHVGNVRQWIFQIWRPNETRHWELIVNLPGRQNVTDKDMDELKERAERVLRWFIADITEDKPVTRIAGTSR